MMNYSQEGPENIECYVDLIQKVKVEEDNKEQDNTIMFNFGKGIQVTTLSEIAKYIKVDEQELEETYFLTRDINKAVYSLISRKLAEKNIMFALNALAVDEDTDIISLTTKYLNYLREQEILKAQIRYFIETSSLNQRLTLTTEELLLLFLKSKLEGNVPNMNAEDDKFVKSLIELSRTVEKDEVNTEMIRSLYSPIKNTRRVAEIFAFSSKEPNIVSLDMNSVITLYELSESKVYGKANNTMLFNSLEEHRREEPTEELAGPRLIKGKRSNN